MTRTRIVFAGTPSFSVPCLDALHASGADIVSVYCQPDRPAGRGRAARACAVKQRAEALDLPVRQPESLRDPEAAQALRALSADLMVVVAYGQLLPRAVLDAPRLGCVNVHASLLPRWRGAAPIQRAIAAGDDVTGVTLMQMDEGLDTGPMLARRETPIEPGDTGGSLHDRLSALGASLLGETLGDVLSERCRAEPQDHAGATYAAKIDANEAWIDWSGDAAVIERRIRAFDPWPVCRTRLDDLVLRVFSAETRAGDGGTAPGTVTAADSRGIDVACGRGTLRLAEVQRGGGRRLAARDFLNGTRIEPGARFAAH